MIRRLVYPLRPTTRQRRELDSWLSFCRMLYNLALEQRILAWHRQRKGLDFYSQCHDLALARKEIEEARTVPSDISRSVLRRLHRSFENFFRGIKKGESVGFPRFKGESRFSSFGIGSVAVKDNMVFVPKMKWVRFKLSRPIKGIVKDVVLKRVSGKWFVCMACDLGEAPEKKTVSRDRMIGIDLGVNNFLVSSSGKFVNNPRYFKHSEEALAKNQERLSRKKIGSQSRRKQRKSVFKIFRHIQNQRSDFHWKLARKLVNENDLIAYENLTIRNMNRSKLAKSIMDVAWGIFIGKLQCKAEEAGVWIVPVDPKNTSQSCSSCGEKVKKSLSDRIHSCRCGLIIDRDLNAARNILARGESAALKPEGRKFPITIKIQEVIR